jgi:hypothetical protein
MAVCLANLTGVDEKENYMDNYTPPDAKELPEGFAPSEYDVICGWARQNFHHGKLSTSSLVSQLVMQVMRQSLLTFYVAIVLLLAGNSRLRNIVQENVPRYVAAGTKIAKGQVIHDIVHRMKRDSPSSSGFLKMEPKSAKWIFIGTDKAKDKVGHALRKAVQQQTKGENKNGKKTINKLKQTSCKNVESSHDKIDDHSENGPLLPSNPSSLQDSPSPLGDRNVPLAQAGANTITDPDGTAETRNTLNIFASSPHTAGFEQSSAAKGFGQSPATNHLSVLSPVGRHFFDDRVVELQQPRGNTAAVLAVSSTAEEEQDRKGASPSSFFDRSPFGRSAPPSDGPTPRGPLPPPPPFASLAPPYYYPSPHYYPIPPYINHPYSAPPNGVPPPPPYYYGYPPHQPPPFVLSPRRAQQANPQCLGASSDPQGHVSAEILLGKQHPSVNTDSKEEEDSSFSNRR